MQIYCCIAVEEVIEPTFPDDLRGLIESSGYETINGEWPDELPKMRGADPVSVAALLALVIPTGLPAFLQLIQNWAKRNGEKSVEIEISTKKGTQRIRITGDVTNERIDEIVALTRSLT
jgi:hypothetical protein